MSSQDIRDWAAVNGWDIATKGRLSAEVKDAYAAAQNGHPEPEALDDIPVIRPDDPAAASTATPQDTAAGPAGSPERPPERPKRPGLFRQAKPADGKPRHKRVSIENILSSGWGLGAMALARRPEAIPISRVMHMQAPVAGIIGEELLKGTVVDRLLQPLARGGRKAELGMALAGPPLLVGIMTAQPQLFPVLRPMLKMSMMSWMEIAEPAMKTVQRRGELWAEKFGDVDLDAMIDALWLDLPAASAPSEQEEENIRRARGD